MGGKRKKAYYKGGSAGGKKYKGAELQQGAVGFMFTFVRDRERGAKSEAYEILNAYVTSTADEVIYKFMNIPVCICTWLERYIYINTHIYLYIHTYVYIYTCSC